MNDNSYNGKVQALLNSTTDQEFLRILKNHRPQFYVSGPLDVDWNQLTMLLMGHVAKHDFVQSARTLGELSKHRFFVHGMMHAQSQITRNAKQYNNHQQAEQHLQYLLARSQAQAISKEIDLHAADGRKPRKL